jgi:hypothetical protein
LMIHVADRTQGPGGLFSWQNATKKRGPGLRVEQYGKSSALIAIPLENLGISMWWLEMQGGGSLLLCGVPVQGKATKRKKKNAEAVKKTGKEMDDKTPMTKNGGWGKNSHQPQLNTTSGKKTWVDVVKSGGINVQIVLGNGNLRLTTPRTKREERRGGAARRLMKRGGNGERGATGRGKGGLEEIISGGNKGRQIGKNGMGREEDREEPGVAASEQTGLLDMTTHG